MTARAGVLFRLCIVVVLISGTISNSCESYGGFDGVFGCHFNGALIPYMERTNIQCLGCRCLRTGLECCSNGLKFVRTGADCTIQKNGCSIDAVTYSDHDGYTCCGQVEEGEENH